ncbi:hypothetical protein [Paenibacillus segetis]|nr:hypothetical protein [Paenibacillus segetis]
MARFMVDEGIKDLKDNHQSRELFTYFGLAVYYSQALEQQLANLIMLMKISQGRMVSEEQFTENFQRKLSSSLGQLVNEIGHHFSFTDEETAQLKTLWKQRNYIVHDYFKQRIHDTFTEAGRALMITELQEFSAQARELEKKLQGYNVELYDNI